MGCLAAGGRTLNLTFVWYFRVADPATIPHHPRASTKTSKDSIGSSMDYIHIALSAMENRKEQKRKREGRKDGENVVAIPPDVST